MYPPAPPPAGPAARLVAPDALGLAGLRRAAAAGGLCEERAGGGVLAVRSGGAGEAHPYLDVEVAQDAVVIRLGGAPDADVWRRLQAVLRVLFECDDPGRLR